MDAPLTAPVPSKSPAAAPRPLRKSRRLASPRKKARELAGRAVRAVDDVAGVIAGELMADRDGAAALEAVERLRVAAVELVRAKAIFIEACQKIAQLAPPDAGASPAVVALGSPDADIPVTVASEAEPVSQAYSGGADALSATVEPSTPPIVSSPVTDDDDDMLNVDESLHPDKDKSSPGTEDEDDMFDVDGRMNQSHIPLSASPTIVRRRSRLRRRYVA